MLSSRRASAKRRLKEHHASQLHEDHGSDAEPLSKRRRQTHPQLLSAEAAQISTKSQVPIVPGPAGSTSDAVNQPVQDAGEDIGEPQAMAATAKETLRSASSPTRHEQPKEVAKSSRKRPANDCQQIPSPKTAAGQPTEEAANDSAEDKSEVAELKDKVEDLEEELTWYKSEWAWQKGKIESLQKRIDGLLGYMSLIKAMFGRAEGEDEAAPANRKEQSETGAAMEKQRTEAIATRFHAEMDANRQATATATATAMLAEESVAAMTRQNRPVPAKSTGYPLASDKQFQPTRAPTSAFQSPAETLHRPARAPTTGVSGSVTEAQGQRSVVQTASTVRSATADAGSRVLGRLRPE